MTSRKLSRRSVLSKFIALLGAVAAIGKAKAATFTPKATEGPFYPKSSMRFDDVDNDLVKIDSMVSEAGGEILHLSGVISDQEGKPCAGLRIEIWQCDMNGKYLHPGDDRDVNYDNGFQGFGHDVTNEAGSYNFRTIVPAKYPGRTPHIHVKILNEKKEILTTQFYIKEHADNSTDRVYNRMTRKQASSVSMSFVADYTNLKTTVNVVV